MVKVYLENSGIEEKDILKYHEKVREIHNNINEMAESETEFLGWVNLPENYDKAEVIRIKKAAERIKNNSDILIVIGIGGSYLGARAVIECLTSSFSNMLSKEKRGTPLVLYAGNNISPNYLNELIEAIEGKDFSINVISKSGTTTEPLEKFWKTNMELKKLEKEYL